MKKVLAFTLSEVLITLGIIGVVSTLTLPNLTNSYRRNVAMTKIEKGYAQIAQAYEQMLDDGGDAVSGQYKTFTDDQSEEEGYNDRNQNARNYFNAYWARFLKSPIFCETAADCGYNSNTPFSDLDGSSVSNLPVIDLQRRATFMTNEGIVYMVNFNKSSYVAGPGENPNPEHLVSLNEPNLIYMDINGGKSPNAFGRDVFVLVKTNNDGLMPILYNTYIGSGSGGDSVNTWYQRCKTDDIDLPKGYACLAYIRRTGWEPARDYKF